MFSVRSFFFSHNLSVLHACGDYRRQIKLSNWQQCRFYGTPYRRINNTCIHDKASQRTLFQNDRGFTLVELLFTCALVAAFALVSTASMTPIIQRHQSDATFDALQRAIYAARSYAISQKAIVSLCPYAETGCGDDWSMGIMIFSDKNNDGKIDSRSGEVLLEKMTLSLKKVQLHWRASGGKNYLRYSPSGMARQFGRFHLCHNNGDLALARSLVINRQGRIRNYYDRNKDGIVEDTDGRIPDCE